MNKITNAYKCVVCCFVTDYFGSDSRSDVNRTLALRALPILLDNGDPRPRPKRCPQREEWCHNRLIILVDVERIPHAIELIVVAHNPQRNLFISPNAA